jgi:hypothetical protein
MLALRGFRPGFRVAVLTAVAAALLAIPATASADLGIGFDPVKDVVDQTSELVEDTTTETLDLVEDTTSGSLPTLGQVVTDVTTQVAQTTQQLADGATGSSGDSGGASDPQAPADSPTAKASSASTGTLEPAASTQAVRTTPTVHGSSVASVSTGTRSSHYSTAHAPPPPRSKASGPAGLAATGWDVAVPLAVLMLLVVVGITARAAERRSEVPRGEWWYRGRHRAPSRWRPELSPVPA